MAKPYTEAESGIIKKEFLEVYEKTDGAAFITCRKVGVPNQTYYYWRDHDQEFYNAIKEIDEYLDDRREGIYKNECFNKKNMIGMIHYLKKRMKHRGYGDDPVINNSVYPLDDKDKEHLKLLGEFLEIQKKNDNK